MVSLLQASMLKRAPFFGIFVHMQESAAGSSSVLQCLAAEHPSGQPDFGVMLEHDFLRIVHHVSLAQRSL